MGPYAVAEVMPNHTYKLERSGQVSVQNEACLKSCWLAQERLERPPVVGAQEADNNVRAAVVWTRV